jgi:glycosyltransferase involved in cell wall biosynthesis
MQISAVIPTCDRKGRLLSLLRFLDRSTYPLAEVIVVDSGNEKLLPAEHSSFTNLNIQYVRAERSVCIQRNTGIRMARSPWILLCDDDIEIANDYLQNLVNHIISHPECGAVTGTWLEKQKEEWKATHPVSSSRDLLWRYLFKLGIWGEIACKSNTWPIGSIKKYYQQQGNHISKAGWPVNTDFGSVIVKCPVYSLGSSLVKKEWLLHSPYDEVLDAHGIGDNYGVVIGFPVPGLDVLTNTFVYHQHEQANRLKKSLQYYRRILALDYFIRTRKELHTAKKRWLVWSLTGNLLQFVFSGNGIMARATWKAIWRISCNRNPYFFAAKTGEKVIEPNL